MAACFDGGVILGADSRTSTGNFVANRAADKITPLADNVWICRSGSAADTQNVSWNVCHALEQHCQMTGAPVEVRTAASVVREVVYRYKDNLSAGLIVAGYDDAEGGAVWALPLGAALMRQPYAIGGSGSAYITGWCDRNWRDGMSRDECREFVLRAVSHAMSRDGSSGGCIRLVVVDKGGARREFVPGERVPLVLGDMDLPNGAPVLPGGGAPVKA